MAKKEQTVDEKMAEDFVTNNVILKSSSPEDMMVALTALLGTVRAEERVKIEFWKDGYFDQRRATGHYAWREYQLVTGLKKIDE
jgi:hypothetical protein